jgi:HAMP domain-containing protein
MKKKLITGLGLIALIVVLSAVFILANLNVITREQNLGKQHERVISRYTDMLYLARSAQAEMYRHQAGYSRDIDRLVEHMLQFEDLLSLVKKDFLLSTSAGQCIGCHSAANKSSEAMLTGIADNLRAYEAGINLIVTSRDRKLTDAAEHDATAEGEKIIAAIDTLRRRTMEMTDRNEALQKVAVARSMYSIIGTLVVGAVCVLIVGVLLLRSITRPVSLLVKGVEKVSSGDYGCKVNIESSDEIGFLAAAFNGMTANLARMTGQREALLRELRELNSTLEQRVQEATEQLRLAHEKVLRSETLSAVGTFASGVAHELATPLSSVLSYFQMIKGKIQADDRFAGDLSLIEGELVRCRKILRGMLDFARAPKTGHGRQCHPCRDAGAGAIPEGIQAGDNPPGAGSRHPGCDGDSGAAQASLSQHNPQCASVHARGRHACRFHLCGRGRGRRESNRPGGRHGAGNSTGGDKQDIPALLHHQKIGDRPWTFHQLWNRQGPRRRYRSEERTGEGVDIFGVSAGSRQPRRTQRARGRQHAGKNVIGRTHHCTPPKRGLACVVTLPWREIS